MADLDNKQVKRLKEKNAELEALIAEWKHTDDFESKWMLYLLREALEMGQIQLREAERNNAG